MLYFSAFQSHLWNLVLGALAGSRGRSPEELVAVELKLGTFPFPRRMEPERVDALRRTDLAAAHARADPVAAGAARRRSSRRSWRRSSSNGRTSGSSTSRTSSSRRGAVPCLFFPDGCGGRARGRRAPPRPPRPAAPFELPKGSYATILVKRITDAAESGAMNLEVLYEDNHCLAVNKPAGVPSQGDESGDGDAGGPRRPLPEAAIRQAGQRLRGAGPPARSADVRRRAPGQDEQGRGRLSAQFRDGVVEKVYWAIVEGAPGEDEGIWIDRLEKDRRTNQSRSLAGSEEGGKEAEVAFRVLERRAGAAMAGVAAVDRAESSAPGAAREPGAADRRATRSTGRGAGSTAIDGGEPDRAARAFAAVQSPDSWGSDRGRGAGAGRLARALAIASGIAVRDQ